MESKLLKNLVLIYVLGLIGVFGHAHRGIECTLNLKGNLSWCEEKKASGAFLAAMVWPLYLSTQMYK